MTPHEKISIQAEEEQIIKPTLDELMHTVDSKYSLVTIVAKRARELLERQEEEPKENPVSISLKEMAGGDLRYYRTRVVGMK